MLFLKVLGGGSGGIASARRAAEFGVKVNHLKVLPKVEELLLGFLSVKIFSCRWVLWRGVGWEGLALMLDAFQRN